jgi:hypothetical protein
MGRTIPSYRLASERERRKWKIFRQELDKSERKMFDEMMSYSRLYNAAGVTACKPVLIQPILMSIVFEHYKQLKKLEDLQLSNRTLFFDKKITKTVFESFISFLCNN